MNRKSRRPGVGTDLLLAHAEILTRVCFLLSCGHFKSCHHSHH